MGIPDKIIVQGQDVIDLLPQKPPMDMVDKLCFIDDTTTISGLHIKAENIFTEHGFFQAPGLIENMAQTVALRAGFLAKQHNKGPIIGFIGGIKDLVIESLPPVGAEIFTEVKIVNLVMDITIVHAQVEYNNNIIAHCELRIFSKPS